MHTPDKMIKTLEPENQRNLRPSERTPGRVEGSRVLLSAITCAEPTPRPALEVAGIPTAAYHDAQAWQDWLTNRT